MKLSNATAVLDELGHAVAEMSEAAVVREMARLGYVPNEQRPGWSFMPLREYEARKKLEPVLGCEAYDLALLDVYAQMSRFGLAWDTQALMWVDPSRVVRRQNRSSGGKDQWQSNRMKISPMR